MAIDDDFGGFDPAPAATPMGAGFCFGYAVCELIFFGMPADDSVGRPPLEVPEGFEPHTATNPFAEGSEEARGWEEAFYDFTQK
jgi:hypothetical protein